MRPADAFSGVKNQDVQIPTYFNIHLLQQFVLFYWIHGYVF